MKLRKNIHIKKHIMPSPYKILTTPSIRLTRDVPGDQPGDLGSHNNNKYVIIIYHMYM